MALDLLKGNLFDQNPMVEDALSQRYELDFWEQSGENKATLQT